MICRMKIMIDDALRGVKSHRRSLITRLFKPVLTLSNYNKLLKEQLLDLVGVDEAGSWLPEFHKSSAARRTITCEVKLNA
jgi:hypothetical protein